MSEKTPIVSHEHAVNAPPDELQETIQKIKNELPKKPQVAEFIFNHLDCSSELKSLILGYVGSVTKVNEGKLEQLLHSDDFTLLVATFCYDKYGDEVDSLDLSEIQKRADGIQFQLTSIYEEYKTLVDEYEEREKLIYSGLTINGERFESLEINRLIVSLYAGAGYWQDPGAAIDFSAFSNEWQRLYQIIRNYDPLSTLGWRFKISQDIRGIIGNDDSNYKNEDDDALAVDLEKDENFDQKVEAVFDSLDAYFDIKNVDSRSIPMIIDLLFQAQELEKRSYDEGEGFDVYTTADEVDDFLHQDRDKGFKTMLELYVENRLKPRLQTVFERLKYDAMMEAWLNANPDYTDASEITLASDQLKKFIKESNRNRSVKSFYRDDKYSLTLCLTDNLYAEYIANDAFYVTERDVEGNYKPITIKALLESKGVGGDAVTNSGIAEYRSLMDLRVRASLKKEFGFNLLDLSFKEQYFFLNYLKRVTPPFVETMQRFTSLYGVNGMRTFLALERGDERLGDQVVAFGQYEEMAGAVFRYYSELLDTADRAEELVHTTANCEGEECQTLSAQVRENILKRAQKDLEQAVRADDPGQVAGQIETYVASAKAYVALLQEVGSGQIEARSASELSDTDKTRMHNLLQANYRVVYPGQENEAFKAAVAGSLLKSFDNPSTTFRILRDQNKIISYNRFDSLSDETGREITCFGSFNADPAYSGVGSIMLEATIKDQLKDGRPMMAHCDPTQTITKKYIEDGFLATGYYALAGKPSFEIWRSEDSSAQLKSKQKSIEDLLSLISQSGDVIVRLQSRNESYEELQQGKALTRYFTHEGRTYLAFETLPATLRSAFVLPQIQTEKKAA